MIGLATARPVVRGGVDAPPSLGLYRAVRRWHFYAGLLVIPFMLLLAVTGGIYLFHDEIDGVLHRSLLTVPERALAYSWDIVLRGRDATPLRAGEADR